MEEKLNTSDMKKHTLWHNQKWMVNMDFQNIKLILELSATSDTFCRKP